ncbi:hypothetical protein [Comamonas sp. C24C]
MDDLLFRMAVPADAGRLVSDMREADRAEVEACSGPDVLAAISASIARTGEPFAVESDGQLLAVGGVVPISLLSGQGSPWLLGTTALDLFPGRLTRGAKTYLSRMQTEYPHLLNYVDARNVRSVRWLRRLGFTVHPAEPYGIAGLPFHLFEMRA